MSTTREMNAPARRRKRGELPSVRYRSSCDSCTEAKVRCDKNRPQCGRCTRMESNCCYSVSMRTSKPTMDLIKSLKTGESSSSKQAEGFDSDELLQSIVQTEKTPTSDTTSFPSSVLVTSEASSLPYLDHNYELINLSLSPPLSSSPTNQASRTLSQKENSFGDLSIGITDSMGMMGMMGMMDTMDNSCINAENCCLSGSYAECPDMFPSMQQGLDLDLLSKIAECPESLTHGHDAATTAANELLVPMEPPQSPTSHNDICGAPTPNQQLHSCVHTAKTLQQCLIMMGITDESMQCKYQSLTGITPTKTTDQALLMCLNISKQIRGVLECDCKGDAYLPFLMTVIISKVLAAYAAIAGVDDSTPFGFTTTTKRTMITKNRPEDGEQRERDDADRESQESQSARFLTVPLRLGAYDVDDTLERLLRVRLVLHELHKIEPVVGLFEKRYCGEAKALDELDGVKNEAVYIALSQFVSDRYRQTREACESTCDQTLPGNVNTG